MKVHYENNTADKEIWLFLWHAHFKIITGLIILYQDILWIVMALTNFYKLYNFWNNNILPIQIKPSEG